VRYTETGSMDSYFVLRNALMRSGFWDFPDPNGIYKSRES